MDIIALEDPILVLATPDFDGRPSLWAILKNSGTSYFVMGGEITRDSFHILGQAGLGQVFLNSVHTEFTVWEEEGNLRSGLITKLKKGYKRYGNLEHGSASLELLARWRVQPFSRAEIEKHYKGGFKKCRFVHRPVLPGLVPPGRDLTPVWA